MYTRCIIINFEKNEVGISIKSEETSSQLELVRNSFVATIHQQFQEN